MLIAVAPIVTNVWHNKFELIVPPVLSNFKASAVSTYDFVVASVVNVGVPNPVILLEPILIAPVIEPPTNFK